MEGSVPAERLVEHSPEREQIAALIEGAALGLLWAHVGELALDLAAALWGDGSGEAEVRQLDVALVGEQHVVRGDVPVDQVERAAVGPWGAPGVVEGLGAGEGDLDGEARRQRAHGVEGAFEIEAVYELHGDPGPVGQVAKVEDLHDVAVSEGRGDPGLPLKQADEVAGLGQLGPGALDGDALLKARGPLEPGEVDLAHTAEGDGVEDLVGADLVGGRGHGRERTTRWGSGQARRGLSVSHRRPHRRHRRSEAASRLGSPRLGSPRLGSPRLGSPRLGFRRLGFRRLVRRSSLRLPHWRRLELGAERNTQSSRCYLPTRRCCSRALRRGLRRCLGQWTRASDRRCSRQSPKPHANRCLPLWG